MQQPIPLRPDVWLGIGIVLAHGIAGCVLALLLPGPLGATAATLVLLLGGLIAWDRAWLRAPRSICALQFVGASTLILSLRNGERLEVQISDRRHVGSRWVILVLRIRPARAILLTGRMLDREAFRQVRLWGLWSRTSTIPVPPEPGPESATSAN